MILFTACKSENKSEASTANPSEIKTETTTEATSEDVMAPQTQSENTAQPEQNTTEAKGNQLTRDINAAKSEATASQATTSPTTSDANSNKPQTKIKFKEDSFDYGKVMEGDQVNHDYSFTNTGDKPLVLSSVTASCGCTVPTWPRDPVAPGKTAVIHAKFDTSHKGKAGGMPQAKTITVVGNFEGSPAKLILRGLVDKKE